MVKTDENSGRRILILAIALSFVLHIFWLSAVKIVSLPVRRDAAQFSKVAFLGPILSSINMEVRAAPASRSFLERRYNEITGRTLFYDEQANMKAVSKKYGDTSSAQPGRMIPLAIDDAVSGEKLEPDYPAE